MIRYKNTNGNSNVDAYELDGDSITVRFMSGSHRHYLYTSRKPGAYVVEKMKALALQGHGLNSYISTTVRSNFERKW